MRFYVKDWEYFNEGKVNYIFYYKGEEKEYVRK
jgi:hypothetical protein